MQSHHGHSAVFSNHCNYCRSSASEPTANAWGSVAMEVRAVLNELMTPRVVYFNSSAVLAEAVAKAAGKLDEQL